MNKIDWINEQIIQNGYDAMQDDVEIASESLNPAVRAELAALLCNYPNLHSEQILLKLMLDKNRDVRLEAVDSISCFKSEIAYNTLRDICTDKYTLIRGYVMLGLGYVTPCCKETEAVYFLREKLCYEKKTFVKICIRCALYRLGQIEELSYLIAHFGRYNYLNQCFIANFLLELAECNCLDPSMAHIVFAELKKVAKSQAVELILSKLERV